MKKISFEMDALDFQNLTCIIHDAVVKYKFDSQTDLTMNQAEKDWMKRHGEYIETAILNKIIAGVQK